MTRLDPVAVVDALRARGLTIATAESLTGGALCARLVDVPGASAVVRGGVIAYATDLKASLLDVDPDLLAERGAVDAEVARQMAHGVVRRTGADLGIATTGVAGPDPQDGQPVGTVHVAVAAPPLGEARHRLVLAEGGRADIRAAAVDAALTLLLEVLADLP
ncbi:MULTISPECIES: CinA family protein [unclassified Janibacter]|uniref:CinA family protein n=1 Tax=unclassified Janibacter TaxID=2649294 RepID=UPI003D08823C